MNFTVSQCLAFPPCALMTGCTQAPQVCAKSDDPCCQKMSLVTNSVQSFNVKMTVYFLGKHKILDEEFECCLRVLSPVIHCQQLRTNNRICINTYFLLLTK